MSYEREALSCNDEDPFHSTTLASLASEIPNREVDIGTAVMPHLLDDDEYRTILKNEFNTIVPEHHMKWDPMCAREGEYLFGPVDKVVDWGNANGMRVKAHTLLWHVTSPSWLNEKTPEQLREALRRHIYTTVAHFRGRVKCWDVVNEALAPDGSLAKTIFLEKLGTQVYEDAFRWAKEADPNAKLIYNDNKVEGLNPEPQTHYCENHSHKANKMFELVSRMKQQGVPIDGVGVQAHFNASGIGVQRPPTPDSIVANIKRYEEIGLTVNISEMDVRTSKLPSSVDKTQAQTDIYHDTLSAALTQPNFEGITYWGFTDKHTWVTEFYYEDTPLLWDKEYSRKPAYHAVARALSEHSKGKLWTPHPPGHLWGAPWMQEEKSNQQNQVGATSNPDWVLESNN